MSETATQKSLLLFQIGPVQDFISAARSTRDLWSGSYLIAYLSAAGIKCLTDRFGKESVIFPSLENQKVCCAVEKCTGTVSDPGQPSLPNRFLACIPSGGALDTAKDVERAIRTKLQLISQVCFNEFLKLFPESAMDYRDRWDRQVESFLQISFQIVPLKEDAWSNSYQRLLQCLAARRNTREFAQFVTDPLQDGAYKDALTGKDEIVGSTREWAQVCKKDSVFRTNEKYYSAMTMIKRLWVKTFLKCNKTFTDLESLAKRSNGQAANYIAVIAMDGDRMGSILSDERNSKNKGDFFRDLSSRISNFANEKASSIVEKYDGMLVYAGGDDVLALLPACRAIDCARELRRIFQEESSDGKKMPGIPLPSTGEKMTVSCGIAFGHHQMPLQILIREAHIAESRAKNQYERDSLALSLCKRSGEILLWGAKFDSAAFLAYDLFQKESDGKTPAISGRFAHAAADLLRPYRLEDPLQNVPVMSKIMEAEFAHICSRQAPGVSGEFRTASISYLKELESRSMLQDFDKLFLCADFLMRRTENNGKAGV